MLGLDGSRVVKRDVPGSDESRVVETLVEWVVPGLEGSRFVDGVMLRSDGGRVVEWVTMEPDDN